MSVTTIPAVGDEFTYSVLVSRGKRSLTSSWAPDGHRELFRQAALGQAGPGRGEDEGVRAEAVVSVRWEEGAPAAYVGKRLRAHRRLLTECNLLAGCAQRIIHKIGQPHPSGCRVRRRAGRDLKVPCPVERQGH